MCPNWFTNSWFIWYVKIHQIISSARFRLSMFITNSNTVYNFYLLLERMEGQKEIIQVRVFRNYFFSGLSFWRLQIKKEAWWDVYFPMLIFQNIFILTDTISQSVKFCLPIKNWKSAALVELHHLNWEHIFILLSVNFC